MSWEHSNQKLDLVLLNSTRFYNKKENNNTKLSTSHSLFSKYNLVTILILSWKSILQLKNIKIKIDVQENMINIIIHITYVPNANKNLKKSSKIKNYSMKKTLLNLKNHSHKLISTMIQSLNKKKFLRLDLKSQDFIMGFLYQSINSTNKRPKLMTMWNK